MDVEPEKGFTSTGPVPLGALDNTTPFGSLMAGPPLLNVVPLTKMLVLLGPRTAVAAMVGPSGCVRTTP